MKRTVSIIVALLTLAACNSNPNVSSAGRQDSIKIVQNSQMRMQDSLHKLRDSLKLDSFERAAEAKKQESLKKESGVQEKNSSGRSGSKRATYVKGYSESGTNTSSAENTSTASQRKKGWSSAAKGAVIGGGAGAVTGLIIDRKKARGAVVGAAVGAGTGYIIGRSKDRKSGRVQKD